ncbi:wax ester/triacylglycerol synthase domain-containing protein [Mycobacterium sp. HUMS_1102779]|uniref:wax ester/triacylglycerol synthase domain-containing protein n=1 Tax=Mycobacterium sp. HUMS_1102779 TaxID=3383487 RepID=UPI00389AA9D9
MAQLKAPDTSFLRASADRHAGLALGAVAVVAGVPDRAQLESLLVQRVQSLPHCTQVLRIGPHGPEWVDHPRFDLAHHLRRVAICRPGGDAELSAAVAFALERPLDPDRPPWECWVIEGLRGKKWAILMKVHHCLAADDSPARILTRLCDDTDPAGFPKPVGATPVSPPQPARSGWPHALWRASSVAGTVADTLVGAVLPALRTPPADASTMRRYRTVRVPIADVDRVCRKFGVTADDVALAAITEGFRTVLLQRGQQPRADSLTTVVPAPIRAAVPPYLPVDHDDPVRRLRTVHNRRKAGQPGAGIVESALKRLPTMLRGNLFQLMDRLPQGDLVTLATSLPGPRRQLRLMGQTMERLLPIPPTAARLSTGVAVLGYGDELVFGITADYHAAPDVKRLAAGIELGMARLVALSQDSVLLFADGRPRKRRTGPAPLTPATVRRWGGAQAGACRHRPTPP